MLAGEALDEMKNSASATEEFRAAVQANPKQPTVHFGLGYMLWMQGQNEEATQEFQAELDNTPEYVPAMLYMADSYIKMNRQEDARPLLEKLVKIAPTSSMAHLDMAIIYNNTGQKKISYAS